MGNDHHRPGPRATRSRSSRNCGFRIRLGLLYSAFTAYCGFRINSGEYKLMGLAPYGEPKYVQTIYDHLIDLKPDGSFWLNLDYFAFLRSFDDDEREIPSALRRPAAAPESPLETRHMDVARLHPGGDRTKSCFGWRATRGM